MRDELEAGEREDVVLRTRHLKKHFGAVKAVEDVSLAVRRGEIFGFLGPNGAGKTTTIGMLLGLTHPTSGAVEIFGEPVTPGHNGALRRVGAMVGAPALLLPCSARQNLRCLAYLHPGLPQGRIAETLELVGLGETGRRPAGTFSTGMKQRLGLALVLLGKPELLILDEPTNGLDPAGIHEVRGLLRGLAERGVTIFLSSHLLHEVELLCDRVAVIHHGRVIAQGVVSELLGGATTATTGVTITTGQPERSAVVLRELPGAPDVQVSGNRVQVQGVPSEVALSALAAAGLAPQEVVIARPDLESVFLSLTSAKSSKE